MKLLPYRRQEPDMTQLDKKALEDIRAALLRIHETILTSDMHLVQPQFPDTWSRWADTILDAAIAIDRKAALPSAPAVEGVEPVAWVRAWNFQGRPCAEEFTDSTELAELWRGHPQTDEVRPLYPSSAIARLTSLLTTATDEFAALRDASTKEVARLTALLAEADEVVKPFALVAEHDIGETEDDMDKFHPMDSLYARAPVIRVRHLRAARRYQQKREAK
jgi:hypothetical protein